MAKRRTRSSRTSKTEPTPAASPFNDEFSEGLEGDQGGDTGETTGRMIMTVLDEGKPSVNTALKALSGMTGLSATKSKVMLSSDFGQEGIDSSQASDANYVVLENLGVVIMNGSPEESRMAMAATPQDQNVIVEPELWNYPLGAETTLTEDETGAAPDVGDLLPSPGGNGHLSRDFLLGARRMLDVLLERGETAVAGGATAAACFSDTSQSTWGLKATEVVNSTFSGSGIRVAVLDTGFDINHPDYQGRVVQSATFIPANEPDNDSNDRNGHGTHCIGTSCGSRNPGIGPRYGVAHGAEIFSGKVLRQGANGRAAGADGWILEGIDWAMQNGSQIISMSLGSMANSSNFPMNYEMAARRGLRAGTLIFAATGNDSRRRIGFMAAVGRPANCPSIAAVSAVDSCLRVADFSNGQRFGRGGEVNFAGPGVDVLSSVPMPRRRAHFDGTSMATPHAAGIAALVSEETGFTGIDLYREMRRRAMRLGNRRDFGNGLVRA